jgi:hypothetical protein
MLAQWSAGVVLVAYATVFLAAALAVGVRRDLT